MDTVGPHVGEDAVGKAGPTGRLIGGGRSANGSQAGHAHETGVDVPPVLAPQVIVAHRGGKKKNRFTERVELELAIDPIADLDATPGVAGRCDRGDSSGTGPPPIQ